MTDLVVYIQVMFIDVLINLSSKSFAIKQFNLLMVQNDAKKLVQQKYFLRVDYRIKQIFYT